MDSGSGNINYLDRFEVKDVSGKLVFWEVGEEVIVKDCKFKVKEIKLYPENTIVLEGMPNQIKKELDSLFEKIPQETFEENQHRIMDFVRNKK